MTQEDGRDNRAGRWRERAQTTDRRSGRPLGTCLDGDRVRAVRLTRCMTQVRLARAAGLSVRTVASAEKGARVSRRTLERLAEVLDVDPESLVLGTAADGQKMVG